MGQLNSQYAHIDTLWVRDFLSLEHHVGNAAAEQDLTDMPPLLFLDPAGGAKTVLMPTEATSNGKVMIIVNTADAPEVLTVEEDSSTTAVATLAQGEMAVLVCDGVTWYSLVGLNT